MPAEGAPEVTTRSAEARHDQPAERPEVIEYRQHRFRPPPGATELLLVRHGESEASRMDRPFDLTDGHADPALHPDGEVQAERVGERLCEVGIDAVYVTTLRRTVQTAAPLCRRLGIEPAVAADLREVHLGDWEAGEFRKRVAEGDPTAIRMFTEQRWDVIPGAELDEVFEARVRAGIEAVVAAHPDQRVAVFTHGGVIGKVLCLATHARGFAFTGADNASVSHLVVAGPRWIVRGYNDTAHLTRDFGRTMLA